MRMKIFNSTVCQLGSNDSGKYNNDGCNNNSSSSGIYFHLSEEFMINLNERFEVDAKSLSAA
jgi:hypothetical protein